MKEPMLTVQNLTAGYPSFLISGITFSIGGNEIVGVIGPNGSGKTTLIKTLSRIIRPREGAVLLSGKDIWQTSPRAVARRVAVVSQHMTMIDLPVSEYVLLGRIPHYHPFQFIEDTHDHDAARRGLEATGTSALKDKDIGHLSGGERQLVSIARALAQEPDVLLLDEPTAHLDIAHQKKILSLLSGLRARKEIAIVIVFHDINLAAQYCDRLLVMKNGKLHATGTPREVITVPLIREVYETEVEVGEAPGGEVHVFLGK